MNANKLADGIEEDVSDNQPTLFTSSYIRKIATMLRQQQARITELEEQRDQAWNLLKEYQK
jgi:hypothetical protein